MTDDPFRNSPPATDRKPAGAHLGMMREHKKPKQTHRPWTDAAPDSREFITDKIAVVRFVPWRKT